MLQVIFPEPAEPVVVRPTAKLQDAARAAGDGHVVGGPQLACRLSQLVLCREYENISYRDFTGVIFPDSVLRTRSVLFVQ